MMVGLGLHYRLGTMFQVAAHDSGVWQWMHCTKGLPGMFSSELQCQVPARR
jgi:hypothetical protein